MYQWDWMVIFTTQLKYFFTEYRFGNVQWFEFVSPGDAEKTLWIYNMRERASS